MRIGFQIMGILALGYVVELQSQTQAIRVGDLPEVVMESSGLLVMENRLITHNDSGNEPLLYVLDTTNLEVVRTVRILGVTNTDWEDLASDEEFIYIADFGNNLGRRTDLRILKISKTSFLRDSEVPAEEISFSYPEQTDFSGVQNSDWDAEALVVSGDSLLLFTKQWQSGGTVAYQLPKTPGEYLARRIDEYQVNGLITAACRNTNGSDIVLLGYSGQLQPFLVKVPSSGNEFSFPAETERISLDIGIAQAEGITPGGAGVYYMSSEAFSNALLNLPASLFKILESEEEEPGGEEPEEGEDPPKGEGGPPGMALEPDELRIYREPGSPILQYAYGSEEVLLGRAVFDAGGRRITFEKGPEIQMPQIDISHLETAVYYLTLYLRGKTLSAPFLSY